MLGVAVPVVQAQVVAASTPMNAGRERWVLGASGLGFAAAVVTGVLVASGLLAVGALALAAVRRWATVRVAQRSRPVAPARLVAADDEVRRLAVSAGISRPIVVLMAVIVAAQWHLLAETLAAARASATADVAELAAVGASLALLGFAGWWWWENRSFGLRDGHGGATRRRGRRSADGT